VRVWGGPDIYSLAWGWPASAYCEMRCVELLLPRQTIPDAAVTTVFRSDILEANLDYTKVLRR